MLKQILKETLRRGGALKAWEKIPPSGKKDTGSMIVVYRYMYT